jgi:hypothetical protein
MEMITDYYRKNNYKIDNIGKDHINAILRGLREECNTKPGDNWEIGFIKPLSSANNMKEVKKLLHYTNLQPVFK